MAGPYYLDPAQLHRFFIAFLELGLAATLLILNARQRTVNARAIRVFAVLLMVLGSAALFNALIAGAVTAGDARAAGDLYRVWRGITLLIDLVGIYFLFVYPRPRTWIGRTNLGAWTVIGVGAVVQVLYWTDPTRMADLDLSTGTPREIRPYGPLVYATIFGALALLGIVFAIDAMRPSNAGRRGSIALVSLGFLLPSAAGETSQYMTALFTTGHLLPTFAGREGVEAVVFRIVMVYQLIVSLAAILVWPYLATRARDPDARALAIRCSLAALAFVLIGLLTASLRSSLGSDARDTIRLLGTIGLLPQAVLPAVALLRYQFLDIRLRLRVTIKASTIGAAGAAAFFIITELAQNVLSDAFGLIVGGVVAGLLMFLARPLHRAAERMARAGAPNAKPIEQTTGAEREAMYRDLLETAWEDGSLTVTERRVLDVARARLGIGLDRATRLESEIVQRAPAPRKRARSA